MSSCWQVVMVVILNAPKSSVPYKERFELFKFIARDVFFPWSLYISWVGWALIIHLRVQCTVGSGPVGLVGVRTGCPLNVSQCQPRLLFMYIIWTRLTLYVLNCFEEINRLVQERCNSSALAMELHLSCTSPSKYIWTYGSIFYNSLAPIWCRSLNFFLLKYKDIFIVHDWYHGISWTSNARSLGNTSRLQGFIQYKSVVLLA